MGSTSSTPGDMGAALRQGTADATPVAPVLVVKKGLGLPDDIVRWRKWLILLSLLPLLAVFNGRWRLGLDSPIYRGLADSLMRGEGYRFGEFASAQIYPGFPLLLAGVQKVFGNDVFRPIPQLLAILSLGLATVALTYHLIGRHFPKWIAVCATCGLLGNARFAQLCNELLTDVPFMCGMTAALLGWSLMLTATTRRQKVIAGIICFAGLLFAASMRPAFWFLAAAWGFSSVWLFFRQSKHLAVTLVFLLIVVVAIFKAIDPRARGMNPLAGGYEQEMLDIVTRSGLEAESRVQGAVNRIRENIPKLLDEHLPAALLGQDMPPMLGRAFSLAVISCVLVFLLPRQPLWALLILVTLAVTPALSTPPRYYVVLTPLVIVAVLLGVHRLAVILGPRWGDLAILLTLLLFTGMNLSKWLPLMMEQHCMPITDGTMAFYEKYTQGRHMRFIELSGLIRERINPGEKVVAPQASIVAYLSGRNVMQERELLPARKSVKKFPEHLASLSIEYAVWPSKFYRVKDPILAKLIDRGVIYPRERLGAIAGMRLHRAEIIVPPEDWTKITNIAQYSTSKKVPSTQAIKKKKAAIRNAKIAKAAKEKELAKQKKIAKEKKAAKLRRQQPPQTSLPVNESFSRRSDLPAWSPSLATSALDAHEFVVSKADHAGAENQSPCRVQFIAPRTSLAFDGAMNCTLHAWIAPFGSGSVCHCV